MLAAIPAYEDAVGNVLVRPDYMPTMVGEDNSNFGYHTAGQLFAIGYMRIS